MRHLILFMGFVLTGCATTQNFVETSAITDSRLEFPEVAAHQAGSTQTVDHSAFGQFLKTYLVTTSKASLPAQGVTLVRYGDVTPEDRDALTAYVDRLQATQVTALDRDEQLAFWINLYNAETIRVILENYPVGSIRSIKSNPLDFKGPWNDKRLTVEDTSLTLDDIENRIVRPVFNDPRIHYGLNCAAIGCPNLRRKVYTGENLDAVLDAQARAFINNPRGVKIEGDTVTASRIFLWYKADYGNSEAGVLEHIRKYANSDLKQALEGVTSIDKYEYNWALNDAKR